MVFTTSSPKALRPESFTPALFIIYKPFQRSQRESRPDGEASSNAYDARSSQRQDGKASSNAYDVRSSQRQDGKASANAHGARSSQRQDGEASANAHGARSSQRQDGEASASAHDARSSQRQDGEASANAHDAWSTQRLHPRRLLRSGNHLLQAYLEWVHKTRRCTILSTTSDRCSKACNGSFAEARDRSIDLSIGHVYTLATMLHYLYHFDCGDEVMKEELGIEVGFGHRLSAAVVP